MLDDGQLCLREEALHCVLVHAGGGAEDSGADVGDIGELEEALDGAVFAEGSVEDRKDDVERLAAKAGFAGESGGVGDESGNGIVRCFGTDRQRVRFRGAACKKILRCASAEPAAGLGDADGGDVEFLSVYCFENGSGGEQRDFMLAAAATEENAYAEFLCHLL